MRALYKRTKGKAKYIQDDLHDKGWIRISIMVSMTTRTSHSLTERFFMSVLTYPHTLQV